ncbi:hypothetical protein CFAM422_012141 [Trichoderma lentiforme]|uniref:Uncharacterized protein n=1 Tax=Trichoderma lentiforme TaxID=1567552 RepID=A0A9P5C6V9_9HYPO|nr:hypothetical protein CFAM422_012141 [Trichoderma lentiforme]
MELGQEHVSRSNDEVEVRRPSWQKPTAACLWRVNKQILVQDEGQDGLAENPPDVSGAVL